MKHTMNLVAAVGVVAAAALLYYFWMQGPYSNHGVLGPSSIPMGLVPTLGPSSKPMVVGTSEMDLATTAGKVGTSEMDFSPLRGDEAATPKILGENIGNAGIRYRQQTTLTADDLLPKDTAASAWASANVGESNKNYLTSGAAHIGIDTVGQSLRNANRQLRSEPPNPQIQVSPWNQSTYGPDLLRRPFEPGESVTADTAAAQSSRGYYTYPSDAASYSAPDSTLSANASTGYGGYTV